MSETEEYRGLTIKIYQDEYNEDPRKNWDHIGVMACAHRSYQLGDRQINTSYYEGWAEIAQELKDDGAAIILPLFLFDHSGISMSTNKSEFQMWDSAGWDWGQVGVIY